MSTPKHIHDARKIAAHRAKCERIIAHLLRHGKIVIGGGV